MERLQLQHTEVGPVPSQNARLTCPKELSVTKEQINSLAKSLDELRLGIDDGDGAHAMQAMQGDTILTSVISVSLHRTLCRTLSSAVGLIDDKLRGMADRVDNIGSTGSGNEKVLSELVDEIRTVISILRVSGDTLAE